MTAAFKQKLDKQTTLELPPFLSNLRQKKAMRTFAFLFDFCIVLIGFWSFLLVKWTFQFGVGGNYGILKVVVCFFNCVNLNFEFLIIVFRKIEV